MTLRWRAARPCDLEWVDWDGGSAVYHRPSGKTHFVNPTTAWLLREFLTAPADADSVCNALADAGATLPDGASLLEHVMGLLARLEELGLVDRVEP